MTLMLRDMPEWPMALNFEEALAYTGLAESELRRHARSGVVRFLPRGPMGKLIAQRLDLDALISAVWSNANSQPSEDMNFGDD